MTTNLLIQLARMAKRKKRKVQLMNAKYRIIDDCYQLKLYK